MGLSESVNSRSIDINAISFGINPESDLFLIIMVVMRSLLHTILTFGSPLAQAEQQFMLVVALSSVNFSAGNTALMRTAQSFVVGLDIALTGKGCWVGKSDG